MALPQGIQRVNFLSPSAPSDGIIHSIAQKGGYQEMITVGERNSIPLFENGDSAYTGFTLSDDIWSSGRRRVGMLAGVLNTGTVSGAQGWTLENQLTVNGAVSTRISGDGLTLLVADSINNLILYLINHIETFLNLLGNYIMIIQKNSLYYKIKK